MSNQNIIKYYFNLKVRGVDAFIVICIFGAGIGIINHFFPDNYMSNNLGLLLIAGAVYLIDKFLTQK